MSSLIPQAPIRKRTEAEPEGRRPSGPGLQQIDLDRIRPNQEQPRRDFEQEPLEELARSLQKQGVLQPVIVRSLPDGGYELVAGERRWRAAQIAGLLKIPALVRDVADEQLLEVALIENLQREGLNPIETALAFQNLIDDFGLTQQEVAERVGRQRATVTNVLRLLGLPPEVQDSVRQGRLSLGHAKVLAGLSSPKAQTELANRVLREELSVRQVEAIVKRLNRPSVGLSASRSLPRDPNVSAAETMLQQAMGTRVRIVQAASGPGRIELHFHSSEELARVYEICMAGCADKNAGVGT